MNGPVAWSEVAVREVALWADLLAEPSFARLLEPADPAHPLRRRVRAGAEGAVARALEGRALVCFARAPRSAPPAPLAAPPFPLPPAALRVRDAAARHADDGYVFGLHAWDPLRDADAVRALVGAGQLVPAPLEGAPPGDFDGRYRLGPGVEAPPPPALDWEDAALRPVPDDLPPAGPGPVALLHDAAALAAAIEAVQPRRTVAGPLTKPDARRLGERLGEPALGTALSLEAHPRWSIALRALEALGAVRADPLHANTLSLDAGLDSTLAGDDGAATDRLLRRVIDRDLHPGLPLVRAALAAVGDAAVDEVIFADLLREGARELFFPRWERDGHAIYPTLPGEQARPWTDASWEEVELGLVKRLLARLARVGVLRRVPGVFAATPDGRRWASGPPGPRPPVWVSGDLELIVPPDALTPGERLQVERLGRCVARGVVDRYRLERAGYQRWRAAHGPAELRDLLERRAPGVPTGWQDTLDAWEHAVSAITLTHGLRAADSA